MHITVCWVVQTHPSEERVPFSTWGIFGWECGWKLIVGLRQPLPFLPAVAFSQHLTSVQWFLPCRRRCCHQSYSVQGLSPSRTPQSACPFVVLFSHFRNTCHIKINDCWCGCCCVGEKMDLTRLWPSWSLNTAQIKPLMGIMLPCHFFPLIFIFWVKFVYI